jgi:hypothetical protein
MLYKLTWSKAGTVAEFFGKITLDTILEVDQKHYNDPRFDDIRYELYDFTQADLSGVHVSDVQVPAAYDFGASHINRSIKVASVATDPHAIELCEHYISVSKGINSSWSFAIFDDRESALEWCTSDLSMK